MPPIKTTIQEAINTIKNWISLEEYNKALRGLDEILEFEPANEEAKKLRDIIQAQSNAVSPAVSPSVSPAVSPSVSPSASPSASPAVSSAPAATPIPTEKPAERIHRKISPIALIAVIAVLMASGGIGYMGSKYLKGEEIQEPPAATEENSLKGSVITIEKDAELQIPAETSPESSAPQTETPTKTSPESSAPQTETPEEIPTETAKEISAPQTEPARAETKNRSPLKFLMDAFGLTKKPVIENVPQEDMLQETTETFTEQFSEQPQRIKVKRR